MFDHKLTLADYFLTVHQVISRGVDISNAHIDGFIKDGFPNETIFDGYLNYLHALIVLFDSHHKTEDDIAFPFFREALPNTHFEWLLEDHDLITGFIEELHPILDALNKREQVNVNLVLCKDILFKMSDRWYGHIGLEEEEFINLIDDLISNEERVRLFSQFKNYNYKLLKPHNLTFPFMLYNLEPQDQRHIVNAYSEARFADLDAPAWRAEWESMIPFLLVA
ncbi:MAG: hemerythrin domain-containing protein [Brevefilum sp.]|nr:hemerythrin domain-containing protein [Brevefilum sp.]